MKKTPFNIQINVDDLLPASSEDKAYMVKMRPSTTFFKDGVKRLLKNKIATISLITIVIITLTSILLPIFWPYSYDQQLGISPGAPVDPSYNNLAPFEYGSTEQAKIDAGEKVFPHIFGTDAAGRDYLIRIVYGTRISLAVGFFASIIVLIIGMTIGSIAGYVGGKVDMVLMRVTEIFTAIPFLPFAMILTSVMSQMTLSEDMRIFIIMAILGVLSWPSLARLVRGQVLVARESEYVTAAKAMGVNERTIAFKHILPNVISVILVTLTLDFAGCMLTESQLSYLGFGVQYPRPTWGNMLNGANNATIIGNYWWQWVFTSFFLAITTICINIVGDTLRDVMDPKSNIDK